MNSSTLTKSEDLIVNNKRNRKPKKIFTIEYSIKSNDKKTNKNKVKSSPQEKNIVEIFQCDLCDDSFDRLSSLVRHKQNKHFKEVSELCKICHAEFPSKYYLACHYKIQHRNEKPLECFHCQRKFVFKYHLIEHLRCHTGEKPFSCKFCDQRFAQSGTLGQHMKRHLKKKSLKKSNDEDLEKYKSKQFSSTSLVAENFLDFNTSETKRKEVFKENEQDLSTSWKEKTFSAYTNSINEHLKSVNTNAEILKKHRRKKVSSNRKSAKKHSTKNTSNDKQVKSNYIGKIIDASFKKTSENSTEISSFICKLCDEKFRTVSDFLKHIKTHEPNKTYQCSYCKKVFNSNLRLNVHLLVHKNVETNYKENSLEKVKKEILPQEKVPSYSSSSNNTPDFNETINTQNEHIEDQIETYEHSDDFNVLFKIETNNDNLYEEESNSQNLSVCDNFDNLVQSNENDDKLNESSISSNDSVKENFSDSNYVKFKDLNVIKYSFPNFYSETKNTNTQKIVYASALFSNTFQ